MMELDRPHGTRRRHQEALSRARRRRRKRRRARLRRVRVLRALRTARFWVRAGIALTSLACVAFWSKFAFVYDIPGYAAQGRLTGISAYVTVKPWWFGPPVFNLKAYGTLPGDRFSTTNPYAVMVAKLGRYDAVVLEPRFVWVKPR
ncbi:MAG: hypothetical protein IRZ33_01135 [Alicyclobacillaceae bacterium]|nr:hypothetical protein [Alicyclobacillaceae bacterium]